MARERSESQARAAREAAIDALAELVRATGCQQPPRTEREVSRWLAGRGWRLIDVLAHEQHRFLIARTQPPAPPSLDDLAARERQVLARASAGHSNKVIAYELQLEASTVRVLLMRAARKLGTKTRRETILDFEQLARLP
jgi:DNA-binding CsgD family transcriptional regulator